MDYIPFNSLPVSLVGVECKVAGQSTTPHLMMPLLQEHNVQLSTGTESP